MDELNDRNSRLSPLKRRLFEWRLLNAQNLSSAGSQTTSIKSHDAKRFPLTHAQQSMWFLANMQGGASFHNIHITIRLDGQLDIAALQGALDEIVKRHSILRTIYRNIDGQLTAEVKENWDLEIAFQPLTVEEEELQSTLEDLVRLELSRSFNLEVDLLFRPFLIRLAHDVHFLLIVSNHIAFDGLSTGVFIRELDALYDAFSTGKPSPLPDVEMQFSDFVLWSQDPAREKHLQEQRDYWLEQLEGAADYLDLPTDHPRPTGHNYSGNRLVWRIPAELQNALKNFSRHERATSFMSLLGAYHVLLYRYTGQMDICVGAPVGGRVLPQVKDTIGNFINTLVLRGDLSGNPPFRQFFQKVRDKVFGGLENQEVPLEWLLGALKPQRRDNAMQLVQVLIDHLKKPPDTFRIGDLTGNLVPINPQKTLYDIVLIIAESDRTTDIYLNYRTDLFEEETMERFLDHYKTLLEGITANPDCPIDLLPLLTRDELDQQLIKWNRLNENPPFGSRVDQLFEKRVEENPEHTAVVCGGRRLTYLELNMRANQLARYLRRLDVGPEVVVGICLERSLELAVAVLAVLKSGGAYVPLDPDLPEERMAFMIQDAGVDVILTQKGLPFEGIAQNQKLIYLDLKGGWFIGEGIENLNLPVADSSLAYVIYTSGSAGEPKGVQVPRLGLDNAIEPVVKAWSLGPADRFLHNMSFNFDAGTSLLLRPLCAGAELHISEGRGLYGADLIQALRDLEITMVALPPSLLAALPFEALPSLRTMIVGGEACPPDLATVWSKGRQFFNMYGPTETSITATMAEIDAQTGRTPIGRPIPNYQVYILDHNLQPVPVGVRGELLIGGVGLARGYLNNPEFTAEKFIPNPFSFQPGERMYRTGDQVRYLADGKIDFLGRIDQQVKLRGYRIELGDIESHLRSHPKVQEAVVTLVDRQDEASSTIEKILAAYVVPNPGAEPEIEQLRAYLRLKLPDYMVPAAIMFMVALPRTNTGKVDRNALPLPSKEILPSKNPVIAPRSDLERVLTGIWADVLGYERIGVDDNFFSLGGHSLLAVRVNAIISSYFGVEPPLRTIFESPTVMEFSERMIQIAGGSVDLEKTSNMIIHLANLTEDDVRDLLQKYQKDS